MKKLIALLFVFLLHDVKAQEQFTLESIIEKAN